MSLPKFSFMTAQHIITFAHHNNNQMEVDKQSIDTKYNKLLSSMSRSANLQRDQLTNLHCTLILTHLGNLQFGLICITRDGTVVPFPQNWNHGTQGVFKFNYKMQDNKNGNNNHEQPVVVQFRLVDNQQPSGSLSVNYTLENSEQLHQCELQYNKDNLNATVKNYISQLESNLQPKSRSLPKTTSPLWIPPSFHQPYPNPSPFPYLPNNNRGSPFNLPYSGEEYISPDHQIFSANRYPRPMKSPGFRYDPIDPFDNHFPNQNRNDNRNDFMGFNEFGQPLQGPGRGNYFNGNMFI